MRETELLLKDILEAISAIERFVEGISFEDFKTNDERSSAVIRKLEIRRGNEGFTRGFKRKTPRNSLEGNGRLQGQINSLLLWCKI